MLYDLVSCPRRVAFDLFVNRVPRGLQVRLRGHRVEAAWLALSGRPIAALGEGQESEGRGSKVGSRRELVEIN